MCACEDLDAETFGYGTFKRELLAFNCMSLLPYVPQELGQVLCQIFSQELVFVKKFDTGTGKIANRGWYIGL